MADETISMKYESKYTVHVIDPFNKYMTVKLKAKKIVIGDIYTTFYDYYGSVRVDITNSSSSFKSRENVLDDM